MPTPITKNLGLIKAIHKGINPPSNIAMLWYDINPGFNIHKYYDVISLAWVPLLSTTAGTTYTFNSTSTVQLVTTGTTITANVKLNSATTNKIQSTVTGLLMEETITTINSLSLSGTNITLSYTGENGSVQTKTVDISPALVDINVANATLNPSTYILTITETDGSTHTVNFSSLLQKGNLIIAVGNMNYPKTAPNQLGIDENGVIVLKPDYSKNEYSYSDFINLFWNYSGGLLVINTGQKNATIKINGFIRFVNAQGAILSGLDLSDIKDTLERGQDVVIEIEASDSFSFYLPAPRVSYVGTGNEAVAKLIHQNRNTWSWTTVLANTTLGTHVDYFKRYFDIYFDNYGNNEWRQLPELRVELCMLKHNAENTGWSATNTNNTSTASGRLTKSNGLRDKFHKAIIHPRHVPYANRLSPGTTTNTMYSGGDGGNHPTEWPFDFNTVNSTISNLYNSNRTKNTNIRIMIDILGFIKSNGLSYYSFPNIITLVANKIYFKNTGYLKTFGNTTKKFQRSFRFYFRLSAADPTSWNAINNRYDRRIYSDYSECVLITPKSILNDGVRRLNLIDVKII